MISILIGMGFAGSGILAGAAASSRHTAGILERLRPSPPAEVRTRSAGARSRIAEYLPAPVGGVLGWWLVGPLGAVAGVVVALALHGARRRAQRQQRDRETEAALAEVARALAAASRAGRSIRRSLESAAMDAPRPVRGALLAVVDDLAMGRPLSEVLGSLRGRLPVADVGLLVSVLEIHLRSGGDLPAALDRVAELVERRQRARRRLRALTAQGRASGAVLAVLPVAFVGLLSGTSGNGLGLFYRTTQGSLLLISGLILSWVGFTWIRRILRRAEP